MWGNNKSQVDSREQQACSESAVASYAAVRPTMTELQREIASNAGIVMDGRDIGTTVFPHADVKPARHSANELYELGRTARADLIETLLDIVYSRLNKRAKSGQVEITISFNYIEYGPIMQNILEKLSEQGYIVHGEKDSKVVYASGEPSYQQYYLTINWDKQTENEDAKS